MAFFLKYSTLATHWWYCTSRGAGADLFNVDFGADNWKQATLHVSLGGLGIRNATDIAAPALISFRNTTERLTELIILQALPKPSFNDLAEARSFRRDYSKVDEEPIPTQRSKQKAWDFVWAKASLNCWACLSAAFQFESEAWLLCDPLILYGNKPQRWHPPYPYRPEGWCTRMPST